MPNHAHTSIVRVMQFLLGNKTYNKLEDNKTRQEQFAEKLLKIDLQ